MIAEIILAGVSFFQPQTQQDSLGVETVNGKTFVIHKVSEKETLYGISKRYGSTVDAVLEVNPSASAGLEIGQIIKVPYASRSNTSRAVTASTGGGIVHVVAAKETMFSISKAYNVSIDEIRQWNNLTDNNLSVGQEVVIKKRNTQQAQVTATPVQNTPSSKTTHVVDAKETLYSIARTYNITVDQIREWNEIDGNDLKIGQTLVVAKQASTPKVVETPKEPVVATTPQNQNTTGSSGAPQHTSVTNTPTENNNTGATVPVIKNSDPAVAKETTTVSTAPAIPEREKRIAEPIVIKESVRNADEISEGGMAELIEGTEGNRKYLALHRTAPVGTILKVKNEMNNREVFVRVTGKLPETAHTEKIVIRISKSAYDRLGAIDPKFRVQVTYYK